MARESRDVVAWAVGIPLSLAAGWVYLNVEDPTVPALLVIMISMGLGLARPQRAWRWALLTSIAVPAAQLFSNVRGAAILRGELQGAFIIGLVSGIVGAVGGSFGHKVFKRLFATMQTSPSGPELESRETTAEEIETKKQP